MTFVRLQKVGTPPSAGMTGPTTAGNAQKHPARESMQDSCQFLFEQRYYFYIIC